LDIQSFARRHIGVFRRLALVLGVGFLVGGCGLSDYEDKMKAGQERVERFDELNKFLGAPLNTPPKKGQTPGDGGLLQPADVDFFLRPPRGIVTAFDKGTKGQFLYHYPAEGGDFSSMYVGLSLSPTDNLWNDILEPFGSFDPSAVTTTAITPRESAAQPLQFETTAFTLPGNPPLSYYIYVYKQVLPGKGGEPGRNAKAVIIYCIPPDKAATPDALKARNMSLETVALGEQAARERQDYRPPAK
jgi:hypothetical protein